MSSVSHAVCVEGSCALVKADWPQSYIYIHYKLFDTVSKNTPVEDGVCYVLLTWVRLCLHAPLFKNGISSCRKLVFSIGTVTVIYCSDSAYREHKFSTT